MFKIPLAEIKTKLIDSGKITQEDLETKLKAKISELSGLISEEGAAHIIANELGVELANPNKDFLKVKEIYPGMRSVSANVRVVRMFEMREFQKGESTGKVQALVVGDDTGTIRLVFWNDQVDLLKDVKENDILAVKDSYVRENRGSKELHLGDKGSIEINPEGIDVAEVRQGSSSFERSRISSLSGGESNVELVGTVVQVFDPRFFHQCVTCNKRVMEQDGKFMCNEHAETEAKLNYVMNAVLDDGTGNIRAVFWKNQTNHFVDKDEAAMSQYKENPSSFEDVKTDLLGEQYKLLGRVQKNDMFNRLEFNVQIVERANPEEELKKAETQESSPKKAPETQMPEPVGEKEESTSSDEPELVAQDEESFVE